MQFEHMVLTGPTIRRLMRQHRVTIRQIKAQHQVTLKRTREVRLNGVRGFMAANWFWIITGRWPDEPKPAAPAKKRVPRAPCTREIGGVAPIGASRHPIASSTSRPSPAAAAAA